MEGSLKMTDSRLGLRARALVGVAAALVASPAAFGSVIVGHATTTWACVAQMSWTTSDSLSSGTLTGQSFFAGPATCAQGNTSPINAGVAHVATYSLGYTYSGNCVEGTFSFTSGGIALFVGGILVGESQSGGEVGSFVAVGTPLGLTVPCRGSGGSSIIWGAPAGVEVGG
jgi:hypothetical protein